MAMSLIELIEQWLWKTFNIRGRVLSRVSIPPVMEARVCIPMQR